MRWLEGPPHLALNPLYFFWACVVLVFLLCCFACNRKKTCFPPEKGHFCLFLSVSLCISLAFFGLPPFLFLCLSLVLFFLPSFLSFFLLSLGSLVLSLSFLCSLLCFRLTKRTTSKYSIADFSIDPFFCFLSCFLFEVSLKSLFLIFVFLILSYVFVQHECF